MGTNVVSVTVDRTNDPTANPHNLIDDAFVQERWSKHRLDKRPVPDSVEHHKSSRKRRRKNKRSVDPLLQWVRKTVPTRFTGYR